VSEMASPSLSGVPETLLAALYIRAVESQRPDALIKDERAEALVTRMGYDFRRIRRLPMSGENVATVLRRSHQHLVC
jgi:O-methyltransferase involved in polyketide biosynthesis